MSSFTLWEDEPSTLKNNSVNAVKDAKVTRKFGTVLADANRDAIYQEAMKSSFIECATSTANLSVTNSVSDSAVSTLSDSWGHCSSLNSPVGDNASRNESTALLLSDSGYFSEIGNYLHQIEAKFQCKPNYMSKQRDISHPMRTVLVDWLVEVADEYKLHRRTLFLAVAYVDRFLSEMSVVRSKLQLLGATCMFIAGKFEEIYPPEAAEFSYLTENTYTVSQILKLERLVLRVLDFQCSFPTADIITERIIASAGLSKNQTTLMYYFSELTLLFGDAFLQYLPSVIASSCYVLSNICLGCSDEGLWPAEVAQVTHTKLSDFYYCLVLLGDVVHKAAGSPNCQSVVSRYKSAAKCLPDRNRIAAFGANLIAPGRDVLKA